jgi:hypothetical protein
MSPKSLHFSELPAMVLAVSTTDASVKKVTQHLLGFYFHKNLQKCSWRSTTHEKFFKLTERNRQKLTTRISYPGESRMIEVNVGQLD